MSGYRSKRSEMHALAKCLERNPQLDSMLKGRKRDSVSDRRGPQSWSGTRVQPRHLPRHFSPLHAQPLRPLNIYCETTNRRSVLPLQCQKHPAGGSTTMLVADRIIRHENRSRPRRPQSRSTIYRKIAEGTFPAQVRISVNGSGLAGIRYRPLDCRSRWLASRQSIDKWSEGG